MIELSNGTKFDFCAASGALAFDGRGWPWEAPFRWLGLLDPRAFVVVAKTVTAEPIAGNLSLLRPWTCVRILKGMGTVNAVGLTNPGVDHWNVHDYRRGVDMGYCLAASVKADHARQAYWIAASLRSLTPAPPFVEVNLSCPNVGSPDLGRVAELLAELKECGHPLILKLAHAQVRPDYVAAAEPYVEAFHAINTVPWDSAFPGEPSPIERYPHGLQGGVSGPAIRWRALRAVLQLSKMTSRPIVGGGGIFSLADVLDFESAGAKAFSIGTCFLHRPWRPNRIARAYRALPTAGITTRGTTDGRRSNTGRACPI